MNLSSHVKEIQDLKFYSGSHPKIRTQLQRNNRPTEFGNKVWETSLVLVNYLQTQPFPLEGLRVLEIGCGWGLLGVYLAKKFNCEVTCSDLDPRVLPITLLHAELNDVSIQTHCASFSQLSTDYLKNFDLIIGAEVCYSDETALEICHLLQRAREAGISEILIGDPGRPGFDDCIEYCRSHFKTSWFELPGTSNGKTTQVLRAQRKI